MYVVCRWTQAAVASTTTSMFVLYLLCVFWMGFYKILYVITAMLFGSQLSYCRFLTSTWTHKSAVDFQMSLHFDHTMIIIMITSISNILKKNWNTSSQEGKKKKKATLSKAKCQYRETNCPNCRWTFIIRCWVISYGSISLHTTCNTS